MNGKRLVRLCMTAALKADMLSAADFYFSYFSGIDTLLSINLDLVF